MVGTTAFLVAEEHEVSGRKGIFVMCSIMDVHKHTRSFRCPSFGRHFSDVDLEVMKWFRCW